jgi:hypothetical protein
MSDDDLTLTTITLTDRERRVCGRALQIAATMMDALDNAGRGVRGGWNCLARVAPEMYE